MIIGIIIAMYIITTYLLVLRCNKWKKECYKWINKWTILKQNIYNDTTK